MKEITINCATIASMAEMHDILALELNLPQWYGRNLDALHDCLTDLREESESPSSTSLPCPSPPPDC